MMNMSNEIDKIAPALVAVQSEMVAIKDADNPFFKSKYAPLDEILKSIRPTLEEHGLTIIQSFRFEDGKVVCISRILHVSGQYIDSEFVLPAEKATPQGYGSAASYNRRYGVCAALSIATPNEDDDGNKAETDAEKAKAKAKEEEKKRKYAEKLENHKDMWREGLMGLDIEALKFGFESVGGSTEHVEKDEALEDLLSQVDTISKLKNAKEAAKKKNTEIEESVK